MFWWKICQIPHVSFSSNFAWHFSVMIDNSSVLFWVKRYVICTKGANQSANVWDFEWLDQNSQNSCHFLNNKSVFLQILFHSSVSWDITPLYFFSWNFTYFRQKEPIKAQIWWNFTWPVESLKIFTLMGSFCPNHIKFQLKKYRNVISHDTECCKF